MSSQPPTDAEPAASTPSDDTEPGVMARLHEKAEEIIDKVRGMTNESDDTPDDTAGDMSADDSGTSASEASADDHLPEGETDLGHEAGMGTSSDRFPGHDPAGASATGPPTDTETAE